MMNLHAPKLLTPEEFASLIDVAVSAPQSALRNRRIVNSISPDGSSRQLSTALI